MPNHSTPSALLKPTRLKKLRGITAFVMLLFAIGLCIAFLAWEHTTGGPKPGWSHVAHYAVRVAIIVLALIGWYWTQAMIGSRTIKDGQIADGLHDLTAPLNRYLNSNPRAANAVLIVSSGCIDMLGLFVIAYSIVGDSLRPFIALLMLFGLRQICQAVCALPQPQGIIWRNPGFPSLFVTYGVGNDFFFSGHTSIAVLGAIELAHLNVWLGAVGALIAIFEATVVIILRAHYTLDVFTAIFTAFCSAAFAGWACGLF
ncbi:MAG: phosphatase PAP2-related protein [Candidatus Sumerlaeota bacterium]|nr:phosphatase PAP2-related protein [Candidatus Sumerlaeota bacterium]